MKHLFTTFALVAMSAMTALADQAYVYVTGNSVNLRQAPDITSQIMGKTTTGDVHPVYDYNGEGYQGDWIQIEIFDADEEGPYGQFVFINKNFVKVLNDSPIPPAVLAEGFEFDDGMNFGFLQFEEPENGEVRYTLMVKNREMQESGGNGIIDNQYDTVRYDGETLLNPEPWIDIANAIYDAATGQMWFAGYLWE